MRARRSVATGVRACCCPAPWLCDAMQCDAMRCQTKHQSACAQASQSPTHRHYGSAHLPSTFAEPATHPWSTSPCCPATSTVRQRKHHHPACPRRDRARGEHFGAEKLRAPLRAARGSSVNLSSYRAHEEERSDGRVCADLVRGEERSDGRARLLLSCDAMQCDALLLCHAMRCNAMLSCSALRCDAMRCDAMRCDAVFSCSALRCDAVPDATPTCLRSSIAISNWFNELILALSFFVDQWSW